MSNCDTDNVVTVYCEISDFKYSSRAVDFYQHGRKKKEHYVAVWLLCVWQCVSECLWCCFKAKETDNTACTVSVMWNKGVNTNSKT